MDQDTQFDENISRIVIGGMSSFLGDIGMASLLLAGIVYIPLGAGQGILDAATEGVVKAGLSSGNLFGLLQAAVGTATESVNAIQASIAAGSTIVVSAFVIHYFAGIVAGGFILPKSYAAQLLPTLEEQGAPSPGSLLKFSQIFMWIAIILPLPVLSIGAFITILLKSRLVKFVAEQAVVLGITVATAGTGTVEAEAAVVAVEAAAETTARTAGAVGVKAATGAVETAGAEAGAEAAGAGAKAAGTTAADSAKAGEGTLAAEAGTTESAEAAEGFKSPVEKLKERLLDEVVEKSFEDEPEELPQPTENYGDYGGGLEERLDRVTANDNSPATSDNYPEADNEREAPEHSDRKAA